MRERARQQEATRRRIVEAAVELHGTVGPAQATISGIADRAGVQRATVYRHFPDEESLFRACIGYGLERDPLPEPSSWGRIADPEQRLRSALDELYAYYERNEAVIGRSLRDLELVPALATLADMWATGLAQMASVLMEGWPRKGGEMRAAAIRLALDFAIWQVLVQQQRLSRPAAVELMARLVSCAADMERR